MADDLSKFLEDAAQRAASDPIAVSIRDLLAHWGQKRRGYWVAYRIERDLEAAGLTTEPHFNTGWIDNVVRLVPLRLAGGDRPSPADEPGIESLESGDEAQPPEVGLQIRSLQSATRGVCSVPPQSDLLHVQSLMLSRDYSQIAVLAGTRDLQGAVTWESVARAKLKDPNAGFADCIVRAQTVRLDEDLLPLIPRINDAGYVFVADERREVCGIVTPTDITLEFATLARPFFLIGEIERRLRRAIDDKFPPGELATAVDPSDGDRHVESADDLTFGEYLRLLEKPDCWSRMEWPAERVVFVQALRDVVNARNEVMHFSPDPLEEERIDGLRIFIDWLRFLDE